MPKIVTLSTGEKVHLKEKFTHRMHKELFAALNKGVVWRQSVETGEFEKEIPAVNIETQYEAVFPLLVDKVVTKDGKEQPYSQDWLDDLLQADYKLLEAAASEVREGPVTTDPATGEKKADA